MHENVFPGGMPVEGKRGNYIALAVTLTALGALLLLPAMARWLYRHHTRKG